VAGAIFVVAGPSATQQGPVAALLSTAGWASAAARLLGVSWVVTPDGIVNPADARRRGSDPALRSSGARRLRPWFPEVAKTAVKDVRTWRRARRFRIDAEGPWSRTEVAYVWQRHELFQGAGLRLARTLGVPSVLFVPAVQVQEAEQWGTRRPGWGRWLERRAERPSLLAADVVACGSEAVVEQVLRAGVRERQVLVTPTGVDLAVFAELPDATPLRRRLGLEGRFIVGWVGSFRPFHALDQVVEAASSVSGATLLVVGDGPERGRIERLAPALDVPATFTGTVPHHQLPAYLASMDVAVLLAPRGEPFHYSPLKLGEYLAAGLPVVAPAVGQLAERLTDGVDAILVPPHDVAAVSTALRRLRDDPEERARLGKAGRAAAEAGWSWERQVQRVVEAVTEVSPGGCRRRDTAMTSASLQ
jgi:glycosyltransferase involved in cell wall biosynthesis